MRAFVLNRSLQLPSALLLMGKHLKIKLYIGEDVVNGVSDNVY